MTEQWMSQGKSFFQSGAEELEGKQQWIEKNECDGINTIMYIKILSLNFFKILNLTSIQLHKVNHSRTNGPINPLLTMPRYNHNNEKKKHCC